MGRERERENVMKIVEEGIIKGGGIKWPIKCFCEEKW